MKKVLLVSPYPYSKTSRGMDVLTECFAELNWDTTHFTFPNVFYTMGKPVSDSSGVKVLAAKKALVPYIDQFMKWFPRALFELMTFYQRGKADFIDYSGFDYIVLESGKPLFLQDLIPQHVKIIYRQSDSVRYILGKNQYYVGLEDTILQRAEKIIVVKERFKELIHENLRKKVLVIRNGYAIPAELNLKKPYQAGTKNTIYVGLAKLDAHTLLQICKKIPDLNVHIFGSCLTRLDLWKLRKLKNFFYYGFQPKEKYLAYLKYADLAILPFKYRDGMKWEGFTTKFLNFMYYRLPIVSYVTGEKSEFEGMGVYFASDENEFSNLVHKLISSPLKVDTSVDFQFYSHAERKKEYKAFIDSLA